MEHELARILVVAGLSGIHLSGGALRFLEGVPRSRWLSAAGGISVAYVFLHLFPELQEGQRAVAEQTGSSLAFLEEHVYLLALAGFALFYGVELSSRRSRERRAEAAGGAEQEQATGRGIFALSIASFAAYNAIIGYIVASEEFSLASLIFFGVALGLHFIVNDFSLREHHKDGYDRIGRFVVVAGIVAGWAVGQLSHVSEAAIALLLAFIAGGVVLNVIKEELPKERRSSFGAFLLAAAAYAALLVAI